MKIVIVGSGYVGLVTGVGLADIGHQVICVDLNPKVVRMINLGVSPIFEEGLDPLLKKNVAAKRLAATVDLKNALVDSDISIISVGTPFDGKNIDLTYIKKAANDIAESLFSASPYHVVCIKSTVIPGTTDAVVGPILERISGRRLGYDLGLCMNPEFLAEGTAVKDFMMPDRIVLGVSDNKALDVMKSVYKPFELVDLIVTNTVTAEVCKYVANSFLATTISFSNEIANLCSTISDVDVVDVMKAVHLDRRLSPILPNGRVVPGLMSFLMPGIGFGGSCFPKDLNAIISYGNSKGYSLRILEAVMETNRLQPHSLLSSLRNEIGDLSQKKIAILGLAFKPGTNDIRESPSITLISSLLNFGASVNAHDPVAIPEMKKNFPDLNVNYFYDLKSAVFNVDAIILVTSWVEYLNLFESVVLGETPIFDGRRILDKNKYENYHGIGLNSGSNESRNS